MHILTLNAGSSSIKYKVFLHEQQTNKLLLAGLIEGIGEAQGHWHQQSQTNESQIHSFSTHSQAFDALEAKLQNELINCSIQGVGHRVVHGGDMFYEPTLINDQVQSEIQRLEPLAPLHNPINVLGIEYARQHFSNAYHVAVFDSGFHHSMPEHAKRYAINADVAQRFHIKRYGFHGINHDYVANQAALFFNKPLSECHFISLHLGNGASACLVKNGQSFDTSMGMTPLAGLMMGTRCGDIDPAIPLYLLKQGLSADTIDALFNKQSGLMGIANDNDMRRILARVALHDESAILAVDMYVYAIQKYIGAYLSQVPKLDALIFTGGIGENAAVIREKITGPLQHLGFTLNGELNAQKSNDACYLISTVGTPIVVIPSNEEEFIANNVAEVINRHDKQP